MLDYYKHNKMVAIKRWQRIFDKNIDIIFKNKLRHKQNYIKIIAYLMGDGHVSLRKEKEHIHYEFSFCPDNQDMLNSFLNAFKSIYPCKLKIKRYNHNFLVRGISKAVVTDLLKEGSFKSLEWRVPSWIENNRKMKSAFLSAFFDCEAYVGKNSITLQSVNFTGLNQIKKLLLEFKIESNIYTYTRKNKNWNTNYILHITKEKSRIRFLKHIGFTHSDKQRKLLSYADVA